MCHCPLWDSPERAQTAQLSLALCYSQGGGGGCIFSPEPESSTASQHKTCVLQPVLGTAVQVALVCSTARASTAVLHSQKCATACVLKSTVNWDLCRFMPVLRNNNKKKRQAAYGILHARDTVVPQHYIPHPPPKATAKLSTEHLERVGQNQLSIGWGRI